MTALFKVIGVVGISVYQQSVMLIRIYAEEMGEKLKLDMGTSTESLFPSIEGHLLDTSCLTAQGFIVLEEHMR